MTCYLAGMETIAVAVLVTLMVVVALVTAFVTWVSWPKRRNWQ